jgi:hypothetical protein
MGVPVPAVLGVCVVAVFATLATAASLGNSADFTFFWGPKAVLFASSRGIDFGALAGPFSNYGHITYPTLWPTIMAFGAMVSGRFPWRLAPMLTPMWLLLSVPLVFVLLRRLLGPREAGAVTVFWYLAMTASLLFSYSGGNAEAPLVVFETVAVLALLVGGSEAPHELGVLAAICLAGAVLTKLEGAVGATLIVAGFVMACFISDGCRWAIRAAVYGAPALGVWLLWMIVRVTHGLPVSDPIREPLLHMSLAKAGTIVPVFARYLQAGSWGIAWLVPLVIVVVRGRADWRRVLPALMLSCGLLAFAFVYYLHVGRGVVQMIVWTLPRLSQPALSCWILAVAMAGAPAAAPDIE